MAPDGSRRARSICGMRGAAGTIRLECGQAEVLLAGSGHHDDFEAVDDARRPQNSAFAQCCVPATHAGRRRINRVVLLDSQATDWTIVRPDGMPRARRGRPHGDRQVSPAATRRPSVLLVAHQVHDRGGMERSLAELIRRAYRDVAFHVLSVTLQEDLRSLVAWNHIRLPLRPFPALMGPFWLASARLARRIDTDLVHTMGAITPGRVDLASVQFCHAAFQSMPDPLSGEAIGLPRRVNKSVARRMAIEAERWCYRPSRTRRFAPASAGVQAELARFYPGVPSTVIPNAADHARFRPDAATRAEVRNALGVSDDTVVVLFLGGDWGRKGLRVTIEGVGGACRAGSSNVALWVVGRGDTDGYRAYARTIQDSPWCTFHGFTAQPERFLAAADVFVSPTTYEAFPLAALEAAACGLPVVATNANGIAELIHDGQEGLIVPREGAAITAAIGVLAQDADLRTRMGAAARMSAGRYTWDAVTRTTLDTYDDLLSGS